jgi:CO dehydrogenase/acetyl-CoA synthase beta subunit
MKYDNALPLPSHMTFLEACNFSIKLLYTHGFITRNQREVIWKNVENDYWKENQKASLDHISQAGKKVDSLLKEQSSDETKKGT